MAEKNRFHWFQILGLALIIGIWVDGARYISLLSMLVVVSLWWLCTEQLHYDFEFIMHMQSIVSWQSFAIFVRNDKQQQQQLDKEPVTSLVVNAATNITLYVQCITSAHTTTLAKLPHFNTPVVRVVVMQCDRITSHVSKYLVQLWLVRTRFTSSLGFKTFMFGCSLYGNLPKSMQHTKT